MSWARRRRATTRASANDWPMHFLDLSLPRKPYTNILIQRASMPARATKKTETVPRSAAVGIRRNGRPRTATASSRIYSDLRAELVSLQRRPGAAISEAEIALYYGVSRTPVREAIL